MTRFARTTLSALALGALTLGGCSVPRPVDDFKQEVWKAQQADTKDALNAVQFLDANNGYVLGENGLVLKTTDGGEHWTSIYPVAVAGKRLIGLSFLNALQGYAISDSVLYQTEDGGNTWKEVRDFKAKHSDGLRGLHFLTPSAGFVVGTQGVYQTLDGTSWVKIDVDKASAVAQAGASAYVVGNYVYRTDLTGVFEGIPASGAICAPKEDCGAAMHFPTPREGWLLAGSGDHFGSVQTWTFKRTRDGGQTWTDGDPQGQLRKLVQTIGIFTPRVKFENANHGWVIVNGDFFATHDGGQNWFRQVQFKDPDRFNEHSIDTENYGYRDISVVEGGEAWLVGTEGRLYKYQKKLYPPHTDEGGLQLGPWRL